MARVEAPTVDELPFDPRLPEAAAIEDWLYRLLNLATAAESPSVDEEVAATPALKGILWQPEPSKPVKEWLHAKMAIMDTRTGFYEKYVRGRDRCLDIVYDRIAEFLYGDEVVAQIVILFRPALKKAPRDDSPREEEPISLKVLRRSEVVLVVVSGEVDALEISPGAASSLGVEKIDHKIFKATLEQMEAEGINFDRVVMLAHRRVARVEMQD